MSVQRPHALSTLYTHYFLISLPIIANHYSPWSQKVYMPRILYNKLEYSISVLHIAFKIIIVLSNYLYLTMVDALSSLQSYFIF